jgi:hypothetical protein
MKRQISGPKRQSISKTIHGRISISAIGGYLAFGVWILGFSIPPSCPSPAA